MRLRTALAGCCVLVAAVSASADEAKPRTDDEIVLAAAEQGPKDHVRTRVFLAHDRLPAGKPCRVAVVIDVERGWHINTNAPPADFLIPTAVTVRSAHGTKAAGLKFPAGKDMAVAGVDRPIPVYEGRVVVFGTLEIPREAAGRTEELTVEVKFQACDDVNCLPPKTTKLVGKVPVAGPDEAVKTVNGEWFDPKRRKPE